MQPLLDRITVQEQDNQASVAGGSMLKGPAVLHGTAALLQASEKFVRTI